ncbi:RNA polymerase sigma-70 factor [Pedobacter metabolipauper]|nr:RNA polymerase sigma-70 factor [Pedobacter metabolipauper]
MSAEISDQELILSWQRGNDRAFELLYKRHAVRLLAVAMSKIKNREVAAEVVQETFMILFNKRSSADQIVNLPAFLSTISKNKILDHYRREVQFQKYESRIILEASELDHSTEQHIDSRDLESQLGMQIEKLPAKCRHVFKLSRQEYLSNKQIAAKLEISENTVEQHMRKALRLLRLYVQHANTTIIIWGFSMLILFGF